MTEETLKTANSLSHEMQMIVKELELLKKSGNETNKRWVGFGQDKQHCSEVSTTTDEFEAVRLILINLKEARFANLKTQFEKL